MSEDFHLIHLRPKLDRLLPWAQRQGLIPDRGQGDLGYAFHAVLRAAFADLAPQPFSFRSGQGLLAYTKQAEAIRLAVAMTTPEVADMLGLDATPQSPGLLIRPFPTSWKAGQLLSFEVRVRPVVRKEDKELDAFLSAAQRMPDAVLSREAVYADWLKRQFEDVADLHEVRMTEFSLSAVVRSAAPQAEGARPKRPVQGPDAVFTGVLRVRDSAAFAALVARGIGRHRAFGFGMLLLKPAAAT
ncbi:type I-E CRISPR-associated protein Cas6/Cse3/CasE [Limnohabitans curvus]|uniref:Type I-E CRISPR-associated protein Cas6/Cse3/CasE n=1 Tax=Limnohabitans curvus TaxID=323423 RepID=A0A315EFB2_9BURK|nr:type I-E CRISPR-associated protein Cas6/Cse3/CasE [Limnohabitans curvus]PUE56513.1 type I-E CRISPR-associated protein Cas6/Cse3/CasE [Limnohabitans curvus]